MTLDRQLVMLFLLPIPIACITWTVTHEEIFREPREWCAKKSRASEHIVPRKFFYLFTCNYCFSHYVTAFFLIVTHFTLAFTDWRGYLISGFSLVWLSNVYMAFYGRMTLDIKAERLELAVAEARVKGELAVDQHPPSQH